MPDQSLWPLFISIALVLVVCSAVTYVLRARFYVAGFTKTHGEYERWVSRLQKHYADSEKSFSALVTPKSVWRGLAEDLEDIGHGITQCCDYLEAARTIAGSATLMNVGIIAKTEHQLKTNKSFHVPGDEKPEGLTFSEYLPSLYDRLAAFDRHVELLRTPARDLFPATTLEELFAKADALKIPRTALARHPLFHEEQVNQAAYEALDKLRLESPKSYLEQIQQHRRDEAEIHYWFERLISETTLLLQTLRNVSEAKTQLEKGPDEAQKSVVLTPTAPTH